VRSYDTRTPSPFKIDAKISANFDPILKALPKGVARIFSCLFAKHETKNALFAALVAAQTEVDYAKILSGECTFEDGKFITVQASCSTEELNPLQIEENQRRREAKVIGHEDLQRLWGRLLAEEIKAPGHISYRALDVLKNITGKEAQLFQRLTPFIESGKIFVCDKLKNELPPNITHGDILKLNECGLLFDNSPWNVLRSDSCVKIENKNHYFACFYNMNIVSIDVDKRISMSGIPLTSADIVAYEICDKQ